MARGWESKAVEDQVAAAESEKANRGRPVLTAFERQRQSQREGFLLSRAKILSDLESASDARHRAMLEQALAHLDREIGAVDQRRSPD
jgi:hypothetical protein